jgi:predicted esterase YcpF (UPF0227 family)
MLILYIHGFGSKFDPTHEKIVQLETLGTVIGVDVDYCRSYHDAIDTVRSAIVDRHVDLIVGTSMGGYLAAAIGAESGIPFVALNPATSPKISLRKWEGNFTDYSGKQHHLVRTVIDGYPDIATDGAGLVIVESGDEVIGAFDTVEALSEHYRVEMFAGGSHRFTHMEKALPIITEFYNQVSTTYGHTND